MHAIARWRFGRRLLIVGSVLLLPAGCYVSTSQTDDDASVAFTPVARVALSSLKGRTGIRLIYSVPKVTRQWARILDSLGDFGYIAFAIDKGHVKIIPFMTLDLELAVVGRNGPIPVRLARQTPYGYSSDTYDVGVQFKPAQSDEVSIDITAHRAELLPDGELVIERYWQSNVKDFLVGASLDADFRPFAIRAGYLGVVLVLLGAAMYARHIDRLTSRWSRRARRLW